MGALSGVRVLDFGQYLAGPLAAMILADNGADVIRVDPPGGARWRHPCNATLQRGKRNIVLDLKDADDLEVAHRLLGWTDVVIEGFRPGVMERLGLGLDQAVHPHLIYCSIPGFPSDDRRADLPGWEGVVQAAASGYARRVLNPTTEPADPAFSELSIASNFAAFIAVESILAALIARHRDGLGQSIEVSLYAAMFEAIGGLGSQGFSFGPRSVFPMVFQGEAADGQSIHIELNLPHHYDRFVQQCFPDEWLSEGMGDYFRVRQDWELALRLRSNITNMIATRSSAEWDHVLNVEAGVPCAVIVEGSAWLDSEQAKAISASVEIDDPVLGPILQPGFGFTLRATPSTIRWPRHRDDEDRQSVLKESGKRAIPSEPGRAGVSSALEGIRVIDTTMVLAGPSAGRILAEFGADVIKINDPHGWMVGHLHTNSGKRTTLIDIASPEGQTLLWRLVEDADVFMQNCTLGVADRIGIGEEDVRSRRPDIVYSSVTAYGLDGPRAAYRGWEPLGGATTGLLHRYLVGGAAGRLPFALCDYGTGHLSAIAILTGLHNRLLNGDGQQVAASLAQAGTYHQIPFLLKTLGGDPIETPSHTQTGWGPLDRLYRASDEWFYLAAPTAQHRQNLASVAELSGTDVMGLDGEELSLSLERDFAGRPASDWVALLQARGVGCHLVVDIATLMNDEDARARGLSILRDHPGVGPTRLVGPAPRLSRTPVRVTDPAPLPGWDTREVVEELGFGEGYEQMLAEGIVAERLSDEALVSL